MKNIIVLLFIFFLAFDVNAQDFTFGEHTLEEQNFERNKIDSNANAVVLKEFGTSRLQLDESTGSLVLMHDYHVKIKIFNKEGYQFANIVIPTYKDGNRYEIIEALKASTFNFSNGSAVETIMDKKAQFTENRSKYTSLTKFTLPNIKDGSIIEYSYHLQSPLIFNFRSWEFQSEIPKLISEYVVFIPANYNYNVSLRGYYKLTDQKSEISKECLRLAGVNIDCSQMSYIMKNVPAFVEESYMTAASNFKSAMYFELSDVQMLNGSKQSYTKNWKDIDYDLATDKNFGAVMKRKDLFKDEMPKILGNATDDLSKAKAIYDHIKKQIRWNNYYGCYADGDVSIKSIVDNRSGNAGSINLILIATLSAANLDAEAVMLSTRDKGIVNKLYPIISDFNYVIAKINIGDKSYLLDATEPLLPFGLLPLRCINDQGRVINLKKPSYWIDLSASQRSITNYVVNGKLTDDGKFKGSITTSTLGYAAFNKRKDIKKENSVEEYVEKLDEKLTSLSILKQEILNINSLELPLIEKYEVEFNTHDGSGKNQFYINPFFVNRITKNPFNLNERTYPVDLGSSTDERIVINFELPAHYNVQEQPKDMSIGLPNTGGRYLLQTKVEDNHVMISQMLQLNKSIYAPEEYLYLKEFFSRIIQNQKTDLLLKAD